MWCKNWNNELEEQTSLSVFVDLTKKYSELNIKCHRPKYHQLFKLTFSKHIISISCSSVSSISISTKSPTQLADDVRSRL